MLFWRPPLVNTSPSQLTLEGIGLNSAYLGQCNTFSILAPKKHHFRPSACLIAIEGAIKPEIKLKAHRNGITCSWKPLTVGLHKIHVKYLNEDIPGSPFSCNVTHHCASSSSSSSSSSLCLLNCNQKSTPIVKCSGPGLLKGRIGRENKVYIEGANRVIGGLSVIMKGPSKPDINFYKTDDENKLVLVYKSMVAGRYLLLITLTGINISGSPFQIDVA